MQVIRYLFIFRCAKSDYCQYVSVRNAVTRWGNPPPPKDKISLRLQSTVLSLHLAPEGPSIKYHV